jgi:hypothetical protein
MGWMAMDFNERARSWLDGLPVDQRAELRDTTGPLPRGAVESIEAAGLPIVTADMPGVADEPVALMPSLLRSILDELPPG